MKIEPGELKKHFGLLKAIFSEVMDIRDRSYLHHDCRNKDGSVKTAHDDFERMRKSLGYGKIDKMMLFEHHIDLLEKSYWELNILFERAADINFDLTRASLIYTSNPDWKTRDDAKIREFVAQGVAYIERYVTEIS